MRVVSMLERAEALMVTARAVEKSLVNEEPNQARWQLADLITSLRWLIHDLEDELDLVDE